jgi:hypothetical protein
MYRVLKPGGQAVIGTWAIPAHVELMRIVGDALMQLDSELPERESPPSLWTSLSSPRRLTQLMCDAGFRSVHVVALAHVWTFEHVDLFARSVLQMTPSWMDLYRRMTAAQKAGFTRALVHSFSERRCVGSVVPRHWLTSTGRAEAPHRIRSKRRLTSAGLLGLSQGGIVYDPGT